MQKYGIAAKESSETGSIVYVAKDGKLLGVIIVADEIKEDSASAIKGLRALGMATMWMVHKMPTKTKKQEVTDIKQAGRLTLLV